MKLVRRIVAALALVVVALGSARTVHARGVHAGDVHANASRANGTLSDGAYELALLDGWARAITEHGVQWLTPSQPALLVEGGVYVELGPDSRLEVVDAGRASAVLSGTTSAEFVRRDSGDTHLVLRRFDRIELHTLRGSLDVALPEGQSLSLGRAVTHLFGSADGRTRVEHLLGDPLELDLGGWYTFDLPVGTRREVPAPLDRGPAARRSADFAALRAERQRRTPKAPTGGVVPNHGVRQRGGLDDSIRSTLWNAKSSAESSWDRFRRSESRGPAGY